MSAPLPYEWTGDSWKVMPGFQRQADQLFAIGERLRLAPVEDRSELSHRHEFAWLREAWASLPFELALQHPTPEHLRKWALIQAGFCTVTDYVCQFKTEARRQAAALRQQTDEYAVVIVSDTVVRVVKPQSQSRKAMGNEAFKASKSAILDIVAGLLEVPAETLAEVRAAA